MTSELCHSLVAESSFLVGILTHEQIVCDDRECVRIFPDSMTLFFLQFPVVDSSVTRRREIMYKILQRAFQVSIMFQLI